MHTNLGNSLRIYHCIALSAFLLNLIPDRGPDNTKHAATTFKPPKTYTPMAIWNHRPRKHTSLKTMISYLP